MADLDVAIEAAARALHHWEWPDDTRPAWEELTAANRRALNETAGTAVTAAAPLIRADERAKVRAELLAIAAGLTDDEDIPALGAALAWARGGALRDAADRIAPDPKETT